MGKVCTLERPISWRWNLLEDFSEIRGEIAEEEGDSGTTTTAG
jgi:hypothetical protein